MRRNIILFSLAVVLLIIPTGLSLVFLGIIKQDANIIDFEVELLTADGGSRMFRISELRGKPVILEFTYVGCAGCEYLHRLGYMQELYDKYRGKIEIVTIFLYYGDEDLDRLRKYKEEFNLNWDYVAVDRKGGLIMELKLPALFSHIFLDENGVERFRTFGDIRRVKELYPKVIELLINHDYEKLRRLSESIS